MRVFLDTPALAKRDVSEPGSAQVVKTCQRATSSALRHLSARAHLHISPLCTGQENH